MEVHDIYRELTEAGPIYIKMGKVVVKDPKAVLDWLNEKVFYGVVPIDEQIVRLALTVAAHGLDRGQAIILWRKLTAAELQQTIDDPRRSQQLEQLRVEMLQLRQHTAAVDAAIKAVNERE